MRLTAVTFFDLLIVFLCVPSFALANNEQVLLVDNGTDLCTSLNKDQYTPGTLNYNVLNVEKNVGDTFTNSETEGGGTGGSGTVPLCYSKATIISYGDGTYYLAVNSSLNTPTSGHHTVNHISYAIEVSSGNLFVNNPGSGSTRIIGFSSPDFFEASTTVNFAFTYENGTPEMGVGSQACVQIEDLTVFQTLTPLCEDVIASGVSSFDSNKLLAFGHYYQYKAVLINEASSTVAQSQLKTLTVGTQSQVYLDVWGNATTSTSTLSDLTLECDAYGNFVSNSLCNLFVLLFVPDSNAFTYYNATLALIPTKFPFSYFYGVVDAIQSVEQGNESGVALSLDLTDSAVVGGNIEILSTTTVDRYLGSSARTVFRTLIGYSLWLAFGAMCFNSVRKLFI